MLEALNQFLEHEGRAGDRRIEGGSEAGAGPGGNQGPAIRPVAAEDTTEENGGARSDLYARALAAEREPCADREDAASELDRPQPVGRRRQLAAQDRFDMRNTAAHRMRRQPENQPSR